MNVCSKTSKILLSIFNVLFLAALTTILYIVLTNPRSDIKYQSLPLIGASLLFLVGLLVIFKIFHKLPQRVLKIITIVNSVIIVIMAIYSYFAFQIRPQFDVQNCLQTAQSLTMNHMNWLKVPVWLREYSLVEYPNNLAFTYLETGLLHLLKPFMDINNLDSTYFVLSSLNVVMLLITLTLMYFLIKKHFPYYIATGYTLLVILFVPLFVNENMFYTDNITMLVLVLLLTLYDKFLHTTKHGLQIGLFIGFIVLAVVGILIKFNTLIFIIAIIIHYCLFHNWKRSLAFVLMLVIPLGLITKGAQHEIYRNPILIAQDTGFPMIHWPLMTLNSGNGSYSANSVQDTIQLMQRYHDTKKVGRIETKEYLQEISNDPDKLFASMYPKIQKMFTDGYGTTMLFTYGPRYQKATKTLLGSMVSSSSKNGYTYLYWVSSLNIACLILMWIGALMMLITKKKKSLVYVAMLSFFGNFLFLLFWESRGRYMFAFIPLIIYIVCYSLNLIISKTTSKHQKVRE